MPSNVKIVGHDAVATAPLVIVIPIFNDWSAVSLLLATLDTVLAEASLSARVVIADDGSTTQPGEAFARDNYAALDVDVLTLRRNMGHQRAIAIALAFVCDRLKPAAVLVMDGDGEDAPQDVPRLIARLLETRGECIVFAERSRRSEGVLFRVFYNLYRLIHWLLTGIPVRVGNFSVIPGRQLERLVVVSELWNHFAAAVFKARLPRTSISTVRARRLSGQSSMNYVALIGHGLSALSVHAELIGVRLLIFTLAIGGLTATLLAGVVSVRLGTDLAIPGWATTAAGILVVLLFQAAGLAIFFVFIVLHGRSQPLFIPIRDYPHFVFAGQQMFETTQGRTSTRYPGAGAP